MLPSQALLWLSKWVTVIESGVNVQSAHQMIQLALQLFCHTNSKYMPPTLSPLPLPKSKQLHLLFAEVKWVLFVAYFVAAVNCYDTCSMYSYAYINLAFLLFNKLGGVNGRGVQWNCVICAGLLLSVDCATNALLTRRTSSTRGDICEKHSPWSLVMMTQTWDCLFCFIIGSPPSHPPTPDPCQPPRNWEVQLNNHAHAWSTSLLLYML